MMNYDQNDCQQFFFITPLFSDTCRYTKNKSWRRCRLYFRGSVGGFLILKQIILILGTVDGQIKLGHLKFNLYK
jgi:hypothetical protein